ncbi:MULTISPECIES: hypothetical protein [unclassified Arenimonas]|uniref:hypothetical protein n=1 Tax=unclassified Arenimonas TaxID=2641713 RepID=UPI00086A8CF5|nr:MULTISPECIES: hypothetical protein [unclassified Arenimonas]ODS62395.1 MAG: hypothetical protein ABS41_10090 [Arenimonas sp. SCN 70-307]
MTPKFKTNLMALSVALGILAAGYGLGEPPSQPVAEPAPEAILASLDEGDEVAARVRAARGALKRQIAMPYVSMAALMPRQES